MEDGYDKYLGPIVYLLVGIYIGGMAVYLFIK